jgi:hypothetical protein
MVPRPSRRNLLSAVVSGAALGLGGLAPFARLAPVSAEESRVTPDLLRYGPDLEPLVRLIEETPQEKCLEVMAAQLRGGVTYRQFIAALFLAALRGPSTIAHSVFATHAAHELSLDAPAGERLLPLFWAFDSYKFWSSWHARNPNRLRALTGSLPPADQAAHLFRASIKQGDREGVERAVVSLARNQGMHAAMAVVWPYAAIRCDDLGHDAIGVANCWRILPTVGWEQAEPVLRWAIGRLSGASDPYWDPNGDRVSRVAAQLPPTWAGDGAEVGLTRELLALLRASRHAEACDLAAERLATGKAMAGAVWDAVHLHAAELMVHAPHVGAQLHANTSANALRYAFRTCGTAGHRLLILLQALAWQSHFRMQSRTFPGWADRDQRIDELEGAPIPTDRAKAAEAILALLPDRRDEAAPLAFELAKRHPGDGTFHRAASRLVVTRVRKRDVVDIGIHDVKFAASIFEDAELVSPVWRPHLYAAAVYWLPGTGSPEPLVMRQAREAFKNL